MNRLAYGLVTLAAAGVVALSAVGVANAASPNIGSSGIPFTTYRHDRLIAAADILKTSTANIRQARKNRSLTQLIQKAGLTKKQFKREMRTKFLSELESQGYAKDQVIIATQYLLINHLLNR